VGTGIGHELVSPHLLVYEAVPNAWVDAYRVGQGTGQPLRAQWAKSLALMEKWL